MAREEVLVGFRGDFKTGTLWESGAAVLRREDSYYDYYDTGTRRNVSQNEWIIKNRASEYKALPEPLEVQADFPIILAIRYEQGKGGVAELIKEAVGRVEPVLEALYRTSRLGREHYLIFDGVGHYKSFGEALAATLEGERGEERRDAFIIVEGVQRGVGRNNPSWEMVST